MTGPVLSRAQVLGVAGVLGALALAGPARAGAQTVQGYTCAESHQSGASSASLSLTDPPASVTAGQSLALDANLTLTLPQSFALAAKASLISQNGLSTTTFGLQVEIGTTVAVVPASIVVGQLQTLGFANDTVTAALTFPAVTVPRTATGEVTVSMPTAAQYPNSATTTPAEVVFNAVLEQENYLGTPSDANVACSDSSTPAPAAQVVAQIPIQAATAAAKATKATKATTPAKPTKPTKATHPTAKPSATHAASTKPSQSSKPSAASTPAGTPTSGLAAATGQSPAGVLATGTPTASSDPGASSAGAPAASPAASSTAGSGAVASATPVAAATPASVTIPPRTVGRGTFIPTWELILMGSLLPLAALAYAWHTRRTYAAARTDLHQRRRSAQVHADGPAPPGAEGASTHQTPRFVTRESQTRT